MTNSSPDYRSTVRETLSRLSDEALRFQDARVVGGIDREELDAEIARRAAGTSRLGSPDVNDRRLAGAVDDVEHDAGCRRCGLPVDFSPLAALRRRLRPGWFLREETIKAPRGYLALEYGLETTTATRTLVAAIAPEDVGRTPELYPEAFEPPSPDAVEARAAAEADARARAEGAS